MKDIAIVYMVAGISSRFGGRIKQFAKIGPNEETLIECSLKQALPAGFSKIIFIVGNKTEQPFKKMFGDVYLSVPVYYALQKYDSETRNRPWGTVDALCSAEEIIDCPFIVCNGDDLYGPNTFRVLYENLQKSNEEATMGYKLADVIPESGSVKRAIFQVKDNYVQNLKEVFNIMKTDLKVSGTNLDDLCSMNIFALQPKTIDLLNQKLLVFKEQHKGDKDIEFLLPNELSKLIEENRIKMKIYPAVDKWYGVTNPEDEEIVRNLLKINYIDLKSQ